jgi:hypothetical protein
LLYFSRAFVFARVGQSEIKVLFRFDQVLIGKSFFTSTVDILPVGFSNGR